MRRIVMILAAALVLASCVTYQPGGTDEVNITEYGRFNLSYRLRSSVFLKSYEKDGKLAFCGGFC
jgi:hypothetical protein